MYTRAQFSRSGGYNYSYNYIYKITKRVFWLAGEGPRVVLRGPRGILGGPGGGSSSSARARPGLGQGSDRQGGREKSAEGFFLCSSLRNTMFLLMLGLLLWRRFANVSQLALNPRLQARRPEYKGGFSYLI